MGYGWVIEHASPCMRPWFPTLAMQKANKQKYYKLIFSLTAKAIDPFLVLYALLPRKTYFLNFQHISPPTAPCLLGSCYPTLLPHTLYDASSLQVSIFLSPATTSRNLRTHFTILHHMLSECSPSAGSKVFHSCRINWLVSGHKGFPSSPETTEGSTHSTRWSILSLSTLQSPTLP